MARPKSDDKRNAILDAATHIIAEQGLSASTASIARAAGVANGSLFTYFDTKADLYNQLYLALKREMAEVSLGALPSQGPTREQLARMWHDWTHWAVREPHKRRALAHLSVSEDLTEESRAAANQAMSGVATLLDRLRTDGPMQALPLPFVITLMNAVAEGTRDFMSQDPDHANAHCQAGFEAFWRMVGQKTP